MLDDFFEELERKNKLEAQSLKHLGEALEASAAYECAYMALVSLLWDVLDKGYEISPKIKKLIRKPYFKASHQKVLNALCDD